MVVESRAQWRDWLTRHGSDSPPITLVLAKKGRPGYVPFGEIIDEALCFGWVDSQVGALDADRTLAVFSRRRPRSQWSVVNKQKVARLMAAALMAPAGMAEVEAAQADGRWTAMDEYAALIEPADLATALDAEPPARAFWDRCSASGKRLMLEWIGTAKQPATRQRRIAQVVADAGAGRRSR